MELIDFIKEYQPKFEQSSDGEWNIFTVATQHVKKPTLEEALEFCYYVIKEKPILEYPTLADLKAQFKAGTLEPKWAYPVRLTGSEVGYRPGFITHSELEIYCSPEMEKRNADALAKIMWGKGEGKP